MKEKFSEYRIILSIAFGSMVGTVVMMLGYLSIVARYEFSTEVLPAFDSYLFFVIALAVLSIAFSSYAGALKEKWKK
jgi:hypothetical protein